MKKELQITLFALLSTQLSFALPLEEITGEDVDLFLSIRDLSETRMQLEEHPIADVFQDKAVVELFKHMIDSGNKGDQVVSAPIGFFAKMEDVFGLTEDEFFELFPGQVSLAFYNLVDQFLEAAGRSEFTLMAEFSGEADQLDELMQIQFERNAKAQKEINPLVEHEMVEEVFMGETLHFDETFNGEETYVEDGYALVDGILVLATPESRLREAVQSIKEGMDASINKTEPYLRSREYAGRGDVSLYLNLAKFASSINTALKNLPIYDKLAFAGITPSSLESALSLESIQALFVDVDVVEDGLLSYYGLLYSEKAGLLSLLEHADEELPEARYVPDNILNGSIVLFDLSALYTNLEKVLGVASPTLLPLIDIQVQTVQTNTGVDLREAIFNNLGAEIISYATLRENAVDAGELLQPNQVFIIEIKDAKAFSQAANTLIDSINGLRPLLKESVFEGETIYSMVAPDASTSANMEMSYAITRSKLIVTIGHISLLHSLLGKLSETDDGFWQKPHISAMFERIGRPNVVARSYYDLGQIIQPLFKVMAKMTDSTHLSESLQSGEVPESLEGAYYLFSEGNEASGGLFGRTLIIKSEDGER